jgi:beta-aspartyl-peptidase (threonine type)
MAGKAPVVTPLILMAISIASAQPSTHKWAVVVHGGAGVITRNSIASTEAAYRAGLVKALDAAAAVLNNGGSSLDAVERAIVTLEDYPLFNAGRGAVFTSDGKIELDAAIMNGATLQAGSVAGVTRTRHPISLARAVMEKSPHVMLIGAGADAFAREKGLEQVDQSYFFTERSWQALLRQLEKDGRPAPPRPKGAPAPPAPSKPQASVETPHLYGTVGVLALDRQGNLAAGTSTGGTNAKRSGRVGDTPIIGAGTYASNSSCAVSGTGVGEYFIRLTVAREVCALVQYRNMSVKAAADEVIQKRLTALKGEGGVIALGPDGQIGWSFNTDGMYRARLQEGGKPQVSIFKEEP